MDFSFFSPFPELLKTVAADLFVYMGKTSVGYKSGSKIGNVIICWPVGPKD